MSFGSYYVNPGAGRASVAKSSSIISPALAFVGCAALSAFVLPLRYTIGRIFTSDEQVVRLVGSLAPIFAAYVISDGMQAALTGVIKGVGKQYIAGPIVVFSYYGVAIPVSTVLALDLHGRGLGMGVKGLCIGTLVGTIVHMLCFMVVVYVYFTRIVVYIIAATIPFDLLWLGPLATELATFAFFTVTGMNRLPFCGACCTV